jgi:predicted ATPase
MITNYWVKNFKCHQSSGDLKPGKVTILSGANSSGKSSILQPLLLLFLGPNQEDLNLNNSFLKLGRFEFIKSRYRDEDGRVQFGFSFSNLTDDLAFSFTFKDPSDKEQILSRQLLNITGNSKNRDVKISYEYEFDELTESRELIKNINIGNDEILFDENKSIFPLVFTKDGSGLPSISSLQRQKLAYVGAGRIGALDLFPSSGEAISNNLVGVNGEFTVALLHKKSNFDFNVEKSFMRAGFSAKTFQFYDIFTDWFNFIFEKDFPVAENASLSTMSMQFGSKDYPQHVGFGLSYFLPILVQGLCLKAGDIFVIENPEAHLEPAVQSRAMEFLFTLASAGVQLFIETHSDHIVNSARREFLKKQWHKKDLSFWHFNSVKDRPSHIEIISVEGSDLSKWPEGFFDQYAIDLNKIYENSHRGK